MLRAVCRLEPGLQNFPDTLKMVECDSDEARRIAHKASRQRSYARHRESINQKRREIYRLTKGERRSVARRPGSSTRRSPRDSPETQVNFVPLHSALYTEALKKVEDVYIDFVIATHASPIGYAHINYQLYQETIDICPPNGYRSMFDKAILEMSSIAQTIRECRRVVLDSNDGGDIRIFDLALEPVSRLVDWLEEMFQDALVSPDHLRRKYIQKELACQNYVSTRDLYLWFSMRRLFGPRVA
ncbi:hypothetical protein ARMGADRAFT_820822 [Armillaria gallica]|uniref:Uncharacterized protein n=1 Tax=Armillaria gallica TaxID=47427 RepID=A0A2H3CZZ5_ARMGA|nr:hypothetical protein ARMGADRAFT_820822 [Armillaria gallica]